MGEVLGDLERILYVNDELDCGPGAPFWRSLIHLGKHVEEVRELVDGSFILVGEDERFLAIDMALPLNNGAPSEDALRTLRTYLPEDEITLLFEGTKIATSDTQGQPMTAVENQ